MNRIIIESSVVADLEWKWNDSLQSFNSLNTQRFFCHQEKSFETTNFIFDL